MSFATFPVIDRPAGRIGLGRVPKAALSNGSGHGFSESGRVGSENLDPRVTLSEHRHLGLL